MLAAAALLGLAIGTVSPAPAGTHPRVVTLPTGMWGTWGWSADACLNPGDDGRVAVAAKSVRFFASHYALGRMEVLANATIRSLAITREEGEPGRRRDTIELRQIGPDRLSITTGVSGPHVYDRCP